VQPLPVAQVVGEQVTVLDQGMPLEPVLAARAMLVV
jgi:hypothetical protein